MDPAILEAATAAWAAMSALAVLLLGIVAFGGGQARPPGSVAFGCFAIVWALQVLAAQSMSYAPAAYQTQVHLAYLAFLLPLPYFLVEFVRSFVPRSGARLAWAAASAATVVGALAVVAALILDPALVYRGAAESFGRVWPLWGPLLVPLVMLPYFGALALAVAALDRARRASTTARTATGHALMAAGLGVFVAFSAGNNLAFYAADAVSLDHLPFNDPYLALFAGLTGLVAWLGVRAARDAAAAPSAKLRRPALLVAFALLVPLSFGVVEGLAAYAWLPRFNSIGLWRLAGVAMIAYGLARARLPALAPRSRHAIATAAGVGAAASLGGLSVGILMLLAPGAPLLLLTATAVPLAALSPSVRLARRALRVRPLTEHQTATLGGRIETYRAALESALARGSLADDDSFLSALREELGISDDVHAALLCIARESILPPPDASHPGYERLRLLGEGAHGRAWLARRHADDELVVLKEPRDQDEEARAALVRQAKLAQRVRHPRLVRIQRIVESPRGIFLVMDHVAGGSLAQSLERSALDAGAAVRLTLDVLEGLEALHEAKITHGDVKPANVLLDAEGRALLADFGLARSHDVQATVTFLGAQGTLAAMAPEQLLGAPSSPSTDLYATGALLFRLLTGEHYLAFSGLDEARARSLVADAPPRLPHPRVPPAIETVLRRALAKDAGQRFASAREMREALERASSGL